MKYFIDTEFIEGFKKPMFGKKRHFIDLISIGVAAEDGREYYAISNEYNYDDADDWVKKNVIIPMYIDTVHGDARNVWDARNFNRSYSYAKSNKQIAQEIYLFCLEGEKKQPMGIGNPYEPVVDFYGYYADYDWVVFCSLFGRMIDLPKGFPMYCRDLKQMLDERVDRTTPNDYLEYFHRTDNVSLEEKLRVIKKRNDYPVQEEKHNALADAKWNFNLYKFLQTI